MLSIDGKIQRLYILVTPVDDREMGDVDRRCKVCVSRLGCAAHWASIVADPCRSLMAIVDASLSMRFGIDRCFEVGGD